MSCHAQRSSLPGKSDFTIALAGNPNVGKSVLFSRMTGLQVTVANYPGKTVELHVGSMRLGTAGLKVIDLPGIYSMSPFSEDQAVAAEAIFEEQPDLIVAVVDSSNLARNLFLVTELLETGFRVVIVLNMVDCAADQGVRIKHEELSRMLGVPVVPMIATRGVGYETLLQTLSQELTDEAHLQGRSTLFSCSPTIVDVQSKGSVEVEYARSRYQMIDRIAGAVTVKQPVTSSFSEKLKHYSIWPATGIPLLIISVLTLFGFMASAGGFLSEVLTISWSTFVSPSLSGVVNWLIGNQFAAKILLWGVDAGILAALAVGIPYVLTFYLVLSILEDSGYLNSLAFLADMIMKRIGLHGRAIIPLLSGAGCNVPAIMGTRVLQTRRERIIASTLITMVPCSARIAIILGVIGFLLGWIYAAAIFIIDLALVVVIGLLLNRSLSGRSPALVMEVFPFRMPEPRAVLRKTWTRFKGFMMVALPIVTIGSLILGALYETGLVWVLVNPTAPLIEGFLGLPIIAGICLLLGILRKELTMQLLMALAIVQFGPSATNLLVFMTPLQLFVFALVVTLYFPCIATASVMSKELGWKVTLLSMALTVGLAILVGGLTYHSIHLLGAGLEVGAAGVW